MANFTAMGLPATPRELLEKVINVHIQFPQKIAELPVKDWIRLIWIVGAYVLARPFLEKGMAKWMAPDTAKLRARAAEIEEEEQNSIDPATGLPKKFSVKAGDIRGGNKSTATAAEDIRKATPTGTVKSKNGKKDAVSSGAEWGSSTRRRQQVAVIEALEKERAEQEEEEDLKDIDPVLLKGWDY